MKKDKKSSIATKLIFYVLLGNIYVSLLFMIQNYIEVSKENTKKINTKTSEIEESIIPTLASSLYEENEEGYSSILKGILSDENIIRVSFLEPDDLNNPKSGHKQLHNRQLDFFNKESPKSFIIKIIDVNYSEEGEEANYLGKLKVYFTNRYIKEKTTNQIINQSLLILSQTIVTTILVYFIFRFLVTVHIKDMVDYSINLDLAKIQTLKDLKLKRKELKKPDELDQLVNSTNEMKRNLQVNHEKILDYSRNLEKKILEATKEINEEKNKIANLMNNIQVSIFVIGKDFLILPPVSNFSKFLFNKDIVGLHISQVLFFNFKQGTKQYQDLVSTFRKIFETNINDFENLRTMLPKKVTIPDQFKKRGKVLKLSYKAISNDSEMIKNLMCTAEDITDSENLLKISNQDQEKYHNLKEIIFIEEKVHLSSSLELSLKKSFDLLDDFISPMSDTYENEHFIEKFKYYLEDLRSLLSSSKLINLKISKFFEELKIIKENSNLNIQFETTNLLCKIFDNLIDYSMGLNLLTPTKIDLAFSFSKAAIEKSKDLEKVFRNLFEYIFLVREIDKIDDEKMEKVLKVAILYPEFERTINLIHQRSTLLSFLFKGIGDFELASDFETLSKLVKQMPERRMLTKSIIKNNLIEPYSIILPKLEGIENRVRELKSAA